MDTEREVVSEAKRGAAAAITALGADSLQRRYDGIFRFRLREGRVFSGPVTTGRCDWEPTQIPSLH